MTPVSMTLSDLVDHISRLNFSDTPISENVAYNS